MRLSELFGGTYRQKPADATSANHELLVRGGFIRPLAAGIYSYLPLALRTLRKIETIIREEMNAIDCQEISMPVVQPAEIWEESGRYQVIGPEMARLLDRAGRRMVLAMTHEEVVTDLARHELKSYRHLPRAVYQIQTKFRDEPRPRAGLIRVREFTMKDAYSFHVDFADLDRYYPRMHRAYFRIFDRCGLPTVAVASDTGMMGGTEAHEFMAIVDAGEDTILSCSSCGYAANRQVASFRRPEPPREAELPLEKVATPNCETIADVATFLGVPESKTAKAVFFSADIGGREELVFAVTRGDMEVNETKLANHLKALSLAPAPDSAIRASGAVPGYASPIGVRNCIVVVDELVAGSPNLVTGANESGFHVRNANYGRDYTAPHVIDLAAAETGSACPSCGSPMRAERAVEVGNIFKLGTKYSEAMKATYLDATGKAQAMVMGCYGIGVGRLMATVVEHSRDTDGIIWPATIAPFDVHLVVVRADDPDVAKATATLQSDLEREGLQVLVDDRDESPGVKFKDADLMGMPVRLTTSPRNHAKGVVEIKPRAAADRSEIAYDEAARSVRQHLASATAAIRSIADAR
jgi:prolyl-tRNA synthetase